MSRRHTPHSPAGQIPDGFWLIDIAERRIVSASPAYERLIGRRVEEIALEPPGWIHSVRDECGTERQIGCIATDVTGPRGPVGPLGSVGSVASSGALNAPHARAPVSASPLESALRQAIIDHQFRLLFQPQISCETGAMVGMEALLRWEHPTRGLLAPSEFLDALESSGLIVEVGAWVIRDACAQTARLHRRGKGAPSVAVNVSPRQFEDPGLFDTVRLALADSGLAPDRLELELTESLLMADPERVVRTLARFRSLGVQISIDDFGTGYSSLRHLKKLPLNALKVDRAFVQDITAEACDVSITRAIISLAHSLNLKVIAEGVQTEGQLALLVANRCDIAQGFLFSGPIPIASVAAMLEAPVHDLAGPPERSAAHRATILLVDDEPNVLSALRRALRSERYQVLTSLCATQALETMACQPVDLVVSDQRMPGMTGIDFLRRVKSLYPNTVRIVLSGYTDLRTVTDAVNEGAVYKFLTKPWDDGELRHVLAAALEGKRHADQDQRAKHELERFSGELASANEDLRRFLARQSERNERDAAILEASHQIMRQIPVPLLGIDDDGLIVFSNFAAERLFGNGMTLMGCTTAQALPPALADAHHAADSTRLHFDVSGQRFEARLQSFAGSLAQGAAILCAYPIGESA